ncbi:MAG: metallophosphoesterase [Pseudomonadota bacterium]
MLFDHLNKILIDKISQLDQDSHAKVLSALAHQSEAFNTALTSQKLPSELSDFSLASSLYNGTLEEDLEKFKQLSDKWPVVLENGEIVNFRKYDNLDPRWIEAFIAWLENRKIALSFPDNPPVIPIADEAKLAIFGDWAGGMWFDNTVASRVSKQISAQQADYAIHLGDTYYSGSTGEVQTNLLEYWPKSNKANFTLNGNHDQYHCLPYFNTVLRNQLFAMQQGCSFFALENSNWVIIGLDTSFFADWDTMYLHGNLNQKQIDFLQTQAAKNKAMILLSHHNGLDITGKVPQSPLYNQVITALSANKQHKYWYWGHIHMGAAYAEQDGIKPRVVGHGVIPFGHARLLDEADQVLWFEKSPADQDSMDGSRVQNGFAMLHLDNQTITEKFYGEDGSIHWQSDQF